MVSTQEVFSLHVFVLWLVKHTDAGPTGVEGGRLCSWVALRLAQRSCVYPYFLFLHFHWNGEEAALLEFISWDLPIPMWLQIWVAGQRKGLEHAGLSLYLDTCSTGAAFEQAGQRCVFMEQYSLANGKMPLNLLIPFPGGSLQIPLMGGA